LSAEAEGCYYDDDDNGDGDSDTVVNSRPSQDDSVIQGSSRDIYSSATSRLSDIEALCEDVRKTDVIGPENGKDCDTPNRPITSRSLFDWADDAIKAFQDECEPRMDRQKEQGDAAVPKPTVSISRSDPASPSCFTIFHGYLIADLGRGSGFTHQNSNWWLWPCQESGGPSFE